MRKLFSLIVILVAMILPASIIAQDVSEAIEVNHETLYTNPGVAINTTINQLVKITVKRTNLQSPMSVYLTGQNAAFFGLSAETLPSGSGETIIYLSYHPTATGVHKAAINFESESNPLLNQMFSVNAVAYDPQNPPTIKIDNSSITNFVADAGAQQQQSFSVEVKNLLDFNGTVGFESQSEAGTFLLNNTSIYLKNGKLNFTITFKPKKAGTFTAKITAKALLAEPVSFEISGYCGTTPPEDQKEGDELVLTTENPSKKYATDFANAEHNKVLKETGWVNVAQVGKRAWWGYIFQEVDEITQTTTNNPCAKVTPYDSKATSDTPCEMLLVSPPLDYNTENKILSFDLRGDFLYDGMTDKFEVCYVEVDNDDIYIEPITMPVPASSDESGKWLPFVVDMSNQNIANTFFIAFRYKSIRGANAPTYYVDNFSWGNPPLSGINDVATDETKLPEDNAYYDLNGRKVSPSTKGILIHKRQVIYNR